MKPMIWHPEEKDEKVNQYLDSFNHEPWIAIYAVLLSIVCLFTVLALVTVL